MIECNSIDEVRNNINNIDEQIVKLEVVENVYRTMIESFIKAEMKEFENLK